MVIKLVVVLFLSCDCLFVVATGGVLACIDINYWLSIPNVHVRRLFVVADFTPYLIVISLGLVFANTKSGTLNLRIRRWCMLLLISKLLLIQINWVWHDSLPEFRLHVGWLWPRRLLGLLLHFLDGISILYNGRLIFDNDHLLMIFYRNLVVMMICLELLLLLVELLLDHCSLIRFDNRICIL